MSLALPVLLSASTVLLLGAALMKGRSRQDAREQYIRRYVFPKSLLDSLRKTYPHLSDKDTFLVARALRSYFLVHARAKGKLVGMPSKAVDALWHEFILDTRAYHAFCKRAFGGYFHHVPASRMRPGISSETGLRRTWLLACLEENIRPKAATRLPLLFAIDEKLRIPDGNVYSLTRFDQARGSSCGGGCGGFACAGDGLAGADAGSGCGGDGGGCGGGCGGS